MDGTKLIVGSNVQRLVSDASYVFENWRTTQPINYQFLLVTPDSLNKILTFSIQITNCQPGPLQILSYNFTGLLGETNGSLTVNFQRKNANISNYSLQIVFPEQYPENITILSSNQVVRTSNRTFHIYGFPLLATTLSFKIFGFQNFESSFFKLTEYEAGHIISIDNSTIYYNLSHLTNCSFPCKYCTFVNQEQVCDQCYSFTLTDFFLLDRTSFSCVKECQAGTYRNILNSTCQLCPTQCQACLDQNTCVYCTSQEFVLNDMCVNSCPSEYFTDDSSNICHACRYPCQTCVSLSHCMSCVDGFALFGSSCLQQCPFQYLQIQKVCSSCLLPCQSCSIQVSDCTSCISNYYLFNGKCYQDCPNNLLEYNGGCVQCVAPCLTCEVFPTKCLSCEPPFKKIGDECLIRCPQNCLFCEDLRDCLYCEQDYLLFNGICLDKCPKKTFSENKKCLPCMNGCNTCFSEEVCVVCENNFYQYQAQCIESGCETPCLTCSSPSKCQACIQGNYLFENTCVSSCPTGYYLDQNNECLPNIMIPQEVQVASPSNPLIFPIPFTIFMFIAFFMLYEAFSVNSVPIFKLCTLAMVSTICITANVFYLIFFLTSTDELTLSLYILLFSLCFNYIGNIIHTILSFFSFRKDLQFKRYAREHQAANVLIALLSFITSQYAFSLYFCRIGKIKALCASLISLKNLQMLNIPWSFGIGASIVGVISGVFVALQGYGQEIIGGIDLLLINLITLICAISLFSKKNQVWQKVSEPQKPGSENASMNSKAKLNASSFEFQEKYFESQQVANNFEFTQEGLVEKEQVKANNLVESAFGAKKEEEVQNPYAFSEKMSENFDQNNDNNEERAEYQNADTDRSKEQQKHVQNSRNSNQKTQMMHNTQKQMKKALPPKKAQNSPYLDPYPHSKTALQKNSQKEELPSIKQISRKKQYMNEVKKLKKSPIKNDRGNKGKPKMQEKKEKNRLFEVYDF